MLGGGGGGVGVMGSREATFTPLLHPHGDEWGGIDGEV